MIKVASCNYTVATIHYICDSCETYYHGFWVRLFDGKIVRDSLDPNFADVNSSYCSQCRRDGILEELNKSLANAL